ncbi:mCG144914, partial [Mus musculus]
LRREQETEVGPDTELQLLLMAVKCPGCHKINPVFSHKQRAVSCAGCCTALSAYRRKSKAVCACRTQHSKHLG